MRLLEWTSPDAYSMFYVLPVALAATAFGERGGALASLGAVALLVVTDLLRDPTPDAVGWATRVVPIVLLGVLLGRATDRVGAVEAQRRRLEEERRRLEVAAWLHQEAIQINDSLVQRMAAAKWSLEAGRTEAALEALAEAVAEAHQLVSGLIRRAEMGGRAAEVGDAADGPAAH